jgi:hypothetical protein
MVVCQWNLASTVILYLIWTKEGCWGVNNWEIDQESANAKLPVSV